MVGDIICYGCIDLIIILFCVNLFWVICFFLLKIYNFNLFLVDYLYGWLYEYVDYCMNELDISEWKIFMIGIESYIIVRGGVRKWRKWVKK